MPKLVAAGPKAKVLPPIWPNAGVLAWYEQRLNQVVDDIHRFAMAKISSSGIFLAQDATPLQAAEQLIKDIKRGWKAKISGAAPVIAQSFAQSVQDHTDLALQQGLRKAGFSVRFQPTRGMNKALNDSIHDNVRLIKSIPAKYLDEVEDLVLESARGGRAMGALTKRLGDLVNLERKPHESDKSLWARTRRRAAFIARDQNNKATAQMHRARRKELGITKCIWRHSLASVHPRLSHEDLDGTVFDSDAGAWDWEEQDFVQPGWLPNCGCVASSVVPGLESDFGL